MRILHSAAFLKPSSGMLNQMRWEQEAAHTLGLDWRVRMFCPENWVEQSEIICAAKSLKSQPDQNLLSKAKGWFDLRNEYHQWLKSEEDNVDVFLLRYNVHDFLQLKFISECKKPVCLVHHTLEVPELASSGGIVSKARAGFEEVIGKHAIRRSHVTVGVTNEIIKYEKQRASQLDKPTVLYPNGIMFNHSVLIDRRFVVPELLFVASSFVAWHGLDLLLKEMKTNKSNFVLHLVGDLMPEDLLIAANDSRIVLHGRKSHRDIQTIAESCWVGLSSFALERKGMTEACTLKVREYLMMGLPVYAGYKETFPDSFQFYQNGSLSVDKILDFARSFRNTDKMLISELSKPHIDKISALSRLSAFLESEFSQL